MVAKKQSGYISLRIDPELKAALENYVKCEGVKLVPPGYKVTTGAVIKAIIRAHLRTNGYKLNS